MLSAYSIPLQKYVACLAFKETSFIYTCQTFYAFDEFERDWQRCIWWTDDASETQRQDQSGLILIDPKTKQKQHVLETTWISALFRLVSNTSFLFRDGKDTNSFSVRIDLLWAGSSSFLPKTQFLQPQQTFPRSGLIFFNFVNDLPLRWGEWKTMSSNFHSNPTIDSWWRQIGSTSSWWCKAKSCPDILDVQTGKRIWFWSWPSYHAEDG